MTIRDEYSYIKDASYMRVLLTEAFQSNGERCYLTPKVSFCVKETDKIHVFVKAHCVAELPLTVTLEELADKFLDAIVMSEDE
jgi:hypothetical protein